MIETSYWADTVPAPSYPEFTVNEKCDVAIVGAGLTGITTALLLAEAGADVVVLESDRVGSGTSGYTTGKVTIQHGLKYQTLSEKKAEAYAAANQAGFAKICEIIDGYGIACDFDRMTSYAYAREGEKTNLLEKEMEAYKKLGINGRMVSETHLPYKTAGALAMDGQAQFHPLKYLYALADIFIKKGGRIYEHSKVVDFARRDTCELSTKKGRLIAPSAVLATNYPLIDFPGSFFLKLHQSRSYAICTDAKSVNVQGMYISINEPANSVRMHYSKDMNRLILVGYGHKTADGNGCDSFERLEDFLQAGFSEADKSPSYRWSAQDCITLDGMPYIGALFDENPNAYVATGFAKWGITNSAAAAMMLADDIVGTSFFSKQVREQFDPMRFTPGASAKKFVLQSADVISAFSAGNARIPSGDYDNLEKGQGAVLRIGGKTQALYREEDGNLLAHKAHCTHMGCPLKYNEAEISFDCPCHGSRFSVQGEVLNGPAKYPLEKIE